MAGFDFGSGPLIHQEDIEIRRTTDPSTGKVVTHYFRRGSADECLPPTFHLQTDTQGHFVPPPTVTLQQEEADGLQVSD